MQIIPVIDLQNGIVVHAKQGNRADYAPLNSQICTSADIFAVINAYRQQFGFSTIYIADLNGITGLGAHIALLTEVLESFPFADFWIDAGYLLPAREWLEQPNYWPVFGSECFTEEAVNDIRQETGNFILSLDHNAEGELGASSLFRNTDLWPGNIIIMSLPYVGSELGPDVVRLKYYRDCYPEKNFIAAGGVRNTDDLKRLVNIGINRCLVASALHNGKIKPQDLLFLAKKCPD